MITRSTEVLPCVVSRRRLREPSCSIDRSAVAMPTAHAGRKAKRARRAASRRASRPFPQTGCASGDRGHRDRLVTGVVLVLLELHLRAHGDVGGDGRRHVLVVEIEGVLVVV